MKPESKDILTKYKEMILITLCCIPISAIIGVIDAVFGRVLLSITAFRTSHPVWLIPFLAVGGGFVAWYYRKFGNGTEQGMSLLFEAAHGKVNPIPLRLIPFVTLGTWITHLFGGSAGREGVAVQIGGTLSYRFGRNLPFKNAPRIFLIAGMAAGFAGLFRTPLAAVFFALEVLTSGALAYQALLPALASSFTASTISGMCGLEKFAVVLSDPILFTPDLIWKILVLGLSFGMAGGSFAFLLKICKRIISEKCRNPIQRIVLSGVILSVMLLALYKGRYAGLGTNLISACFQGNQIYGYDWLFKFILTVFTLSAGFQGGEVTPLFSIGASLGIAFGRLLGLPLQFTAAMGYAAVFGSASNTLLAPILIGTEVFGFAYLPYFFVVCAVSYLFNCDQTIYGKQQIYHMLDGKGKEVLPGENQTAIS